MKRYVVHRKDTHEYMQEVSSVFGNFCSARLFCDNKNASHVINTVHNGLSDKLEVLEIELTKWMAKEILEGRP